MRALSALILTYCFGCVIPESFNGKFVSPKPAPDGGIGHFGENLTISRGTVVDVSFANDRIESSLSETLRRYRRGVAKNQISDGQDNRSSFTYDPAAYDRPSNNRYPPESFYHTETRASKLWSFRVRRILALDENFETKLADGPELRPCNGPVVNKRKNSASRNGSRDARKNDPDDWDDDDDDDDAATEDDGGENTGEWDAWTEWSECSASCGCGRQVRWQHCVGKGCAFGLKRAQIRTCHLRDCNNKNLLSWLGMKA